MKLNILMALLGTTCVASLVGSPALAQETTAPPQAPSATLPADQVGVSPSADDSSKASGDVVVTGSRIVNPNIKSAAPIQVLTSQEIKLSGAVNIEDALNRLPQVYATNPSADQESAGQATIQLRAFGSGHQSGQNTLTLIDGQRLAGQIGVDINSIPTALVDRVDVLTGGAAAVYGPDALAGVVNFILKKDFEGVQIDANYGFFDHVNRRNVVTQTADQYGLSYPLGRTDDGGRANVTVTAGHRFLDDRVSLSGYFSYRHTDPILFTDRSIDACQLLQSTFDAPNTCGVTRTSPYGRIIPQSGPNAGTSFVNANDGTTRAFHTFTSSDLVSRYGSSYQMLRENERYNAGGFLNIDLAPAAKIYGSFMYTDNATVGSYDPTSIYAGMTNGGYTLNCSNPLMSQQQAQAICGTAAGTNTTVPIDLAYRFNLYPAQTVSYRQLTKRATLGVRGDFASAWHYDVNGVYANDVDYARISANQLPNTDNIAKALNVVSVNGTPTCVSKINGTDPACVPLDIFRGNSSDLSSYNYIFNTVPAGVNRSVGFFVDALASVSGDLGHYGITSPLADAGVQIGLNAEFRREVQKSFSDANYNTINAGSANPASSGYGAQSTKEGAFELQIPLVQNQSWTKALTLSGGYRLSKYNTSPDTFSTWKVEGTWSPVADITFRTARNFASRAPNAYEATPNVQFSQRAGYVDPCGPTPVTDPNTGKVTYTAPQFKLAACQQQRGWQDSFYNNTALLCPDSGCVFRSGNASDLGPQEANTLTYGLVLTPRFLPRFSFSIDRYSIQFTNQIYAYGPDDFNSLCALYPVQPTALNQLACQHFYRNANGQLFGSINSPSTGFLSGETINIPGHNGSQGIDLQGHYDFPIRRAGQLSVDFNGSITEIAGDASVGNKAGFFSTFIGDPVPKWRHNARFTFQSADKVFSASVNWRYVGGTKAGLDYSQQLIGVSVADLGLDGYTPPQQTFAKIKPYNYFDLGFTATVSKRLTLSLVVNNLLDKDPPLVPAYGSLGTRSISGGYQNAITNFYDLYGRYIQFGVSTKF